MRYARPAARFDVRVTLACGCTLYVRNNPLSTGARYSCPSGLGHGYQVAWASWHCTASGRNRTNETITLARLRDQALLQAEQHRAHHRLADADHATQFAADCQTDLDRLTAARRTSTQHAAN